MLHMPRLDKVFRGLFQLHLYQKNNRLSSFHLALYFGSRNISS